MPAVSEVLLDEPAVHRFRQRYRGAFGATGTDDPLYESVSAGRRYSGMEHWLPLYYEQLETVFDYLPGAGLSFDHQAEEARAHRIDQIAEFYAARRSVGGVARGAAPVYRALPPDRLYLDDGEWRRALAGRPVDAAVAVRQLRRKRATTGLTLARARRAISPPSAPTPEHRAVADGVAMAMEAVRDYLKAEREAGHKTRDRGVQRGFGRAARGPCCASAALSDACAAWLTATRTRATRSRDCRRPLSGSRCCRSSREFATDALVVLGEQDILGDRLSAHAAAAAQPRLSSSSPRR